VVDADVLYAEHAQRVFRYLCRIVGPPETARDLTQEVFLRVARSPVPNGEPGAARAWVFRIARNLALNHLRDERRRPAVSGSVSPADRSQPAVQELGVEIDQALAALSDADRHVFLLREVAGLTYVEIAGACEMTVEAVRARLYRARQQLRVALEGPMRRYPRQPIRLPTGDGYE
jgi:RNA polymerase sigma-70 factor (ECF subfamily)